MSLPDPALKALPVLAVLATLAGLRTVDLLPVLRDELATLKAASRPAPDTLVFPTQEGGAMNASNVRRRLLAKAVERADERLRETSATPLPSGLTPHKLRHTFASCSSRSAPTPVP